MAKKKTVYKYPKRKFLQLTAKEHSQISGLNQLPLEIVNQSLRYTNVNFYRSKKLIAELERVGISENIYVSLIRGVQEAGVIRKVKKARSEGKKRKAISLISGLQKRKERNLTEVYKNKYGVTNIITSHGDGMMTITSTDQRGHAWSWTGHVSEWNGLDQLLDMVIAEHSLRYANLDLDEEGEYDY